MRSVYPEMEENDFMEYVMKYKIKIGVLSILMIGTGLFVLADGPNVLWQFVGICTAACGFFLLVGGYAHLRGLTVEQLNNLEVKCSRGKF